MKRFLFIILTISTLFSLTCCKDKKNENTQNTADKLEQLNAQINKEPKNAGLYYTRANYYLQANEIIKAYEDIMQAIKLDDKKSNYYVTQSSVFLALGKVQDCNNALQKAIELDAKNEEAFLKLAELNLYLKDYNRTYENLSKVISINDLNAKAYYLKGFAKKEEGDTANAVKAFRKCIDIEPDYFKAYMELGYLYLSVNNKLAVDYFNSALNVSAQNIDALYALGMYYLQNEQIQDALKEFEAILRINPNYTNALFNIGLINNEYLKNHTKAIEYLAKAIKFEPTYAEAYYETGLAYERLKDIDNAKTFYHSALEQKPNYPEAEEALKRLGGKH